MIDCRILDKLRGSLMLKLDCSASGGNHIMQQKLPDVKQCVTSPLVSCYPGGYRASSQKGDALRITGRSPATNFRGLLAGLLKLRQKNV